MIVYVLSKMWYNTYMKTQQYKQAIVGILNEAETKLSIQDYYKLLNSVSLISHVRAETYSEAFTDCVQKVIDIKKTTKKGGSKGK